MPLVYARGLRLDATCLVIGTMGPDLEYFARVKLVSRIGHELWGIAAWCVPVTILCAWLFHRVVKWPLVRIAPRAFAGQLAAYAERRWMPAWTPGAVAILILSAALGSLTHIVWDSFTHAGTWGTEHVAFLREFHDVPVVGRMATHRILQHGCSVVALVILGILAVGALRSVEPRFVETGPRGGWLALVTVATILAYAKMFRAHETDIGSMIVAPMCGVIYGSLIYGAVSRRISSPRRSSAT